MLVSGVLFVGVTGIVRYLGSEMNPIQAAFIRYAFGIVLVIPVILRLGLPVLFAARIRMHAARGLVHGIGVMLWFYAMSRLPIAEVTALGFTAPIFTAAGAMLLLGERLRAHRVAGIVLGFAGALIVLRPGLRIIDVGALAMLTAAPLFACSLLLAKVATRTEPSSLIVVLLSLFCTVTLLPLALVVWRTPTLEELALLFVTAVLATSGHYTLNRAFQAAELTALQPFSFLQLVWATLLGLLMFGERPDFWIWAGAGLIVISATWIARREVSESRAQRNR
ncbi:MAG: DMT family transporter [Arenicellales bacterium]|jgi:drug/metabolite transporter (DMT)-like permease|nr:EamA family transporter [Acidiferrobacteraceae bacterium]MDP6136033.1 DMT family transporter [Arenicellales bacterium]MDP6392422.1 DMT family transporter [Arenicellales bacterium]MDP7218052.1 DMT family transporter [Arenicellales bacterium]|tara:strand:- start:7436 stop:8275 length:840 start_codon:yes stop_codon:yes gene_type:complete